MNNQFVILALLGLVSVEAMPITDLGYKNYDKGDGAMNDKSPEWRQRNEFENKDPNQWWGNGNGQGSEKLDGIWHAAHNTADTAGFDKAVSKNAYSVGNANQADAEPANKYQTGYYAQYRPQYRPQRLIQRDIGQMVDAPIFNYYTDGKGAGSEKQDSFWDIAHQAEDSAAFDKTAAKFPGISSGNGGDAAPGTQYYTKNFAQMMTPPPADAWRPSVYPDREMGQMVKDPVFKYYTNGNGAGSEKQDWAWDIAHQAETTEQFHKQAAYFPGIDSDNKNNGAPATQYFNGDQAGASLAQAMAPPAPDAWRASVYPEREMGQMVKEPVFKYYTNGNGAGSEKQDWAWDIAHQAETEEEFHKKAAYFPGIDSDNKKNGEPVSEYFGGDRTGASL